MRAKFVNFERGQQPYDALDVGLPERRLKNKIRKALEEILPAMGLTKEDIVDESIEERITFKFKTEDWNYITHLLEDPDVFTVGWYKENPVAPSGNGDDIYVHSLEKGIELLKFWNIHDSH